MHRGVHALRTCLAWAQACALAVLLTLAGAALAGGGTGQEIEVRAIPVELDPERPDRERVGRLLFLGGFELESDSRRFGGLSGLEVSPDGKRLRAISDRGHWITADLTHDSEGRLTGMDSWRVAPMLTPEGEPLQGALGDAEGLARQAGGRYLVSFERSHRIWQYPVALQGLPRPVTTPPALDEAPANGGLEAITVLPDGAVMGVTELDANRDGSLRGWIMQNDSPHKFAYVAFSYAAADNLGPTALATLPGGDVLLLERDFGLWGGRARIVRLARERLQQARRQAGTRLHGEVVADLGSPLTVDNFEGLALRRDPEGRTFLYLVSDDNFLLFQKTLLLQFRLMEEP